MSKLCEKTVLVINNCYEPLNFITVKRAMTLIVKGRAKAEETLPIKFYSGKLWDHKTGELVVVDFYLPTVIRLLSYRYLPAITKIVTRKNIFNRDKNTCLYCGIKLQTKNLTLDHVIPVSRGGKDTWENLVTCCRSCNKKKNDRLLSEIQDMRLAYHPKPVNIHTGRALMRNLAHEEPSWKKYLYYESVEN